MQVRIRPSSNETNMGIGMLKEGFSQSIFAMSQCVLFQKRNQHQLLGNVMHMYDDFRQGFSKFKTGLLLNDPSDIYFCMYCRTWPLCQIVSHGIGGRQNAGQNRPQYHQEWHIFWTVLHWDTVHSCSTVCWRIRSGFYFNGCIARLFSRTLRLQLSSEWPARSTVFNPI